MKMKLLRGTFVSHTMVNCLNKYYTLPDPTNYGWKKENTIWIPVWFERNVLPNIEDVRSISLQSVLYNDNEADIIDESEADTEISEDEDAVISGDDQEGDSSDID